jgi:hypothetical protein
MSTWFITGCSTGPGRALATAVPGRDALDAFRQVAGAQPPDGTEISRTDAGNRVFEDIFTSG